MGEKEQSGKNRSRVAVIGGGIAGLSAAWQLQKAGVAVELFEASPKLGGILGTVVEPPYLIERAADNFATLDTEAVRWCEEMGLSDELIAPNSQHRRAMVLHHGKPVPIPAGFSLVQPTRFWPMVNTPLLSWRGKLRAIQEYFVPAKKDDNDESLESFAVRRLGREVFDRLVEPIVSGIFTADPARLSMKATLPQFVAMERKHGGLIRGWLASRKGKSSELNREASGARYAQFLAPKKGMSWWIDTIASKLESSSDVPCVIRKSASVKSLRKIGDTGEPWHIELQNGSKQTYSGVVVATPARTSAELLHGVAPTLAEEIKSIQYASSAVVVLVVNRSDIARMAWCFGIVVPRVENRPVLAISFSSLKYPNRVPDDQLLVRIFLGGASHPEILEKSDGELEQLAKQQLQDIIGWQGETRWAGVVRWNQAMPQYHVGHVAKVDRIMEDLRTQHPSLGLAGAGFRGVGIPQCVGSGRKAAEQVIAALTTSPKS